MKPSKKLQKTAYHEAGHVVAAYLNRLRFSYVTIEPGEDSLGHVMYVNLGKIPDLEIEPTTPKIRNFVEKRIIAGLAGHAAERIFEGRNNWLASSSDVHKAVELADYICGSNEQTEAYVNWLFLCARDLMKNPRHWAAVERLAEELLKQNRIGYREARHIVEDVLYVSLNDLREIGERLRGT